MKSTIIAIVATLALATPALAWDDNWAEQQNLLAQQQAQEQFLQQQLLQQQQMQDRAQAQFNWGARCAARNYQNCY